ncbi:hypothetical protein FACS1894109_11050 [Spirochaetia bacterium]|nr:hypothetical protein FACS1894109_11050 [Spirochaetia bacterium]
MDAELFPGFTESNEAWERRHNIKSSNLPPGVQAWAERHRAIKALGKEQVIKDCVGTAVARFCTTCNKGSLTINESVCQACRVYEFARANGIGVLYRNGVQCT